MDASRAEMELENDKLRRKIDSFQSDLDQIRGKMDELMRENERLIREVRRSGEERMGGTQTDGMASLHTQPIFDIQKRQIQLLEEEKEDLERLYQDSQETINRLEADIRDLKHPLQPHLMKLNMEAKQVQEEFARAEGELLEENQQIRDELTRSRKELINSQLRIKELERENERNQLEVQEKQDQLRQYLKKEMGYDGTMLAFQNAMDGLEVRLQHAVAEKEAAQQQREDLENKLKQLSDHNNALHAKLDETMERLRQQQMEMPLTLETHDEHRDDLIAHAHVHRTIDELIAQAAIKTRDAVEEVEQKYNENLQKILEEYNQMQAELDKKNLEFEKCLRAKRLIEEELDKTVYETKLFHEKNTIEQADAEKRRSQAERERNEIQIKFEQVQQNYKVLQQTFDAEKANHQLKEKELTERLQKISNDLDRTTNEYTSTFNELNELKKKISNLQNEQTSMQRRMTDLIKRHEEQMLEKEKDCLVRLAQRDEVNRSTFNELRNLVNRQQRMIVKYKEECHMIASQSETKISEMKQKMEHLRNRNDQLQSDMADLQRKDAEMNRIMAKNAKRIKTLEERLKDAEEQAVEASRRVAKQLVRDRLAILPSDHYSSYSGQRGNPSTTVFGTTSMFRGPLESIEPMSDEK